MKSSPIPYEQFLERALAERCGARSWKFLPTENSQAWRGECSLQEFLDLLTIPAWYLGPSGGAYEFWNTPGYVRIRYREALEREDFRKAFSELRYPQSPLAQGASVLALHCSTCHHSAIIDGNHRLTRVALGLDSTNEVQQVHLTYLSGAEWRTTVPDMNKICGCISE